FEGLVKLGPEPDAPRWRPALAMGRPELGALGRRFALPKNAFWSDGRPVSAADVRSTLRLLQNSQGRGRVPSWADDLVDDASASDPFRVQLTLRQGYLDPLALMAFKVLPEQTLQKPDDKEFAKKPVGSGPFRYAGHGSDPRGREYVRFLA